MYYVVGIVANICIIRRGNNINDVNTTAEVLFPSPGLGKTGESQNPTPSRFQDSAWADLFHSCFSLQLTSIIDWARVGVSAQKRVCGVIAIAI
jgi:hypothetical protein